MPDEREFSQSELEVEPTNMRDESENTLDIESLLLTDQELDEDEEEGEEDDDFFISPEDFYEDCGCGFSTGCLTTCAEEAFLMESEQIPVEDKVPDAAVESELSLDLRQEESASSLISDEPNSASHDENEERDEGASDDQEEDGLDRTCFVATAAYANPKHPDVIHLRKFRDEWLVHRAWGRIFVRVYWRVGPELAHLVAARPFLVRVTRSMLSRIVCLIKIVRRDIK